ncbi:MAG: type II secretion system protein [Limisphaerales bacterium]
MAFTLIEVMVAMALLSLIVIALMTVFSSTQAAFRASVTQSDVLESGRAAMDMITTDLRAMTPSMGYSNVAAVDYKGAVNFYVRNNLYGNPPLLQSLVASSGTRTNLQQDVFILSQGNQNGVPTWYGTGYAVCVSPSNTYSLYRFSTNLPVAQNSSASNLFYAGFVNFIQYPNSGNYSHLLDGVVDFRVRAFDASGTLISTNRMNILTNSLPDTGYYFYSNALPAAVEIEMATLEDRILRRADSIPVDLARSNYLSQQAARFTSSASAWPSRTLTPRFTNETAIYDSRFTIRDLEKIAGLHCCRPPVRDRRQSSIINRQSSIPAGCRAGHHVDFAVGHAGHGHRVPCHQPPRTRLRHHFDRHDHRAARCG